MNRNLDLDIDWAWTRPLKSNIQLYLMHIQQLISLEFSIHAVYIDRIHWKKHWKLFYWFYTYSLLHGCYINSVCASRLLIGENGLKSKCKRALVRTDQNLISRTVEIPSTTGLWTFICHVFVKYFINLIFGIISRFVIFPKIKTIIIIQPNRQFWDCIWAIWNDFSGANMILLKSYLVKTSPLQCTPRHSSSHKILLSHHKYKVLLSHLLHPSVRLDTVSHELTHNPILRFSF